jgi:hypothetical protein
MNCGNVPIIIAPQAAHSYVKASSEKGATKQELLQTAEHWRTLIEDNGSSYSAATVAAFLYGPRFLGGFQEHLGGALPRQPFPSVPPLKQLFPHPGKHPRSDDDCSADD